MSQKGRQISKKNNQNWRNIYVYHLKPWQSWQVVAFHSYECQGIETKF